MTVVCDVCGNDRILLWGVERGKESAIESLAPVHGSGGGNVLRMGMGTHIFCRLFSEFGKHDDKEVALEM